MPQMPAVSLAAARRSAESGPSKSPRNWKRPASRGSTARASAMAWASAFRWPTRPRRSSSARRSCRSTTASPFDLAQIGCLHPRNQRWPLLPGHRCEPRARATPASASKTGKPLSDTRKYVEQMRAAAQQTGPLPPIVLATLRKKMVELSIGDRRGRRLGERARARTWPGLALHTFPRRSATATSSSAT